MGLSFRQRQAQLAAEAAQEAQSDEAGDPRERVIEAAAQRLLLGAGAESEGGEGE